MRRNILFALLSFFTFGSTFANWQYPGTYIGDGWFQDDGSKLTVSVRGGLSWAFGKISNEVNAFTTTYYINKNGQIVSKNYYLYVVGDKNNYSLAGQGNLGDLKANKNFSDYSFFGGASVGFIIPYMQNWRMEFNWDHITQMEYNTSPLFKGSLKLDNGKVIQAESGGVFSSLSSDIFGITGFYDFYKGNEKPLYTMLPYLGIGFGYADVRTSLILSDLFGDLSDGIDIKDFGELNNEDKIIRFYKSERSNYNISALLTGGFSYGIAKNTYLDFGIRLNYIPKVKFSLSNQNKTKYRDWFGIKGIFYTNFAFGIRFEF